MSNDFDFTSEIDDQKSSTARAVSLLFGGALLVLSAITSAAFFWQYTPGLFDFLSTFFSPYLAAITGVLVFEVASVAWAWLRANDADTHGQLAIANTGAWGAMIGGLSVTAVYFMLNNSLLAGSLDATAETVVNIAGGLLIVTGIAGNFCLAFMYRNNAAKHQRASHQAELRALTAAAKHSADTAAAKAALSRALTEIKRQLPERADIHGRAAAAQYLSEHFRPEPTSTPANGRHKISLVDLARRQEADNRPLSASGRRPEY